MSKKTVSEEIWGSGLSTKRTTPWSKLAINKGKTLLGRAATTTIPNLDQINLDLQLEDQLLSLLATTKH